MKKSGFTMIELIFVIVIIGILAAVAIPKLAATRTDAKVSALSQEIQSAVSEIPAYVTSQGGDANATSLLTESQVLNQLVAQNKAKKNSDSNVTVYGDDTTECVRFETNDTSLKIITNTDGNGTICKGVRGRITDATYTIAGSGIKF